MWSGVRWFRILVLAAVGLAALPGRGLTADEEWPQWRGPRRDGVSREQGLLQEWPPGGPAVSWTVQGLGSGFSSLAVAGGRILTLGDLQGTQYVIAIDAADGSVLWKTRVGTAHTSDPGRDGSRSTPTVDGDRVYALGTEGDLVCLDAGTGAERWRCNLVTDFGGQMMSRWKFSESPLVDGERLIVTPGAREAMLVALDKRTGSEVWRSAVPELGPAGHDGAGYSSIVISEGPWAVMAAPS